MNMILIAVFLLGYCCIAFEEFIKVNKSASALLTGILCWVVYVLSDGNSNLHALPEVLGEISGILFFLLGAMTIVEIMDSHDSFDIITAALGNMSKKKFVWIIALISFFLSAFLDNLTTTIVVISLLRSLITDQKERWLISGLVVISANAGGVFSPIGDVTTTMLWMGNQITAASIIKTTFLPSICGILLPALFISRKMTGNISACSSTNSNFTTNSRHRKIVLILGISILFFVPIFKSITHLPPYMGMLLGLSILWVVTELMHRGKNEQEKGLLSVNHAIRKIDTPSILFFLGILLSIAALQHSGVLHSAAIAIQQKMSNLFVLHGFIGVLSSVVDNVPLVAAVQGMYSLEQYPTDHLFWNLLAYCAGTGGSLLIIGSAAGVAAMGIEKIPFMWYLKKIGWLALISYLSGLLIFVLCHA